MPRTKLIVLFLAAALVAFSALLMAGEAATQPAEHMEVKPTDTCDGCHAELTPAIHKDWFESKHGILNVKCFVCHGAVGPDFVKVPAPERCLGCHGEQVESMQDVFMKDSTCFSCHPPHRLSPHTTSEEGEVQ